MRSQVVVSERWRSFLDDRDQDEDEDHDGDRDHSRPFQARRATKAIESSTSGQKITAAISPVCRIAGKLVLARTRSGSRSNTRGSCLLDYREEVGSADDALRSDVVERRALLVTATADGRQVKRDFEAFPLVDAGADDHGILAGGFKL